MFIAGSPIASLHGGPIALNRSSPVGAKLRHLFVPGVQLAAAGGGIAVGAAGDIQALRHGKTAKYTGTNASSTTMPGASAYPFVLVWAGRFLSSANNWRGLEVARSGGSGDAHYVRVSGSTQVDYGTRNNFTPAGGPDLLTLSVPGGTSLNTDLVVVAQSLSATDHRLYCLGGSSTSSTNSGTPAGAFDTLRLASNGNVNQHTYLAAFGTTALTDAEALALSASVPEALRMLLAPQQRRIWVPVASGTVYTSSLTESASASDAQSATWAGSAALTESVTAAEAITAAATLLSTITESAALADALAAAFIAVVVQAEAVAAADAASTGPVYSGAATEAATAGDAITAAATLVAAVAEAAAAGDVAAAAATWVALLTEPGVAADTVAAAMPGTYNVSITELAAALDAVAAALANTIELSAPPAGHRAELASRIRAALGSRTGRLSTRTR